MTNVMHKLFIYLFTSALHVSGFLFAHLQRLVYNFGSGSSLLGMVLAQLVHYVGHYIILFQNARSLYNIKFCYKTVWKTKLLLN
jgi:hypothetical protein